MILPPSELDNQGLHFWDKTQKMDDNQSVRTESEFYLFKIKNNSGVLNWIADLMLSSQSVSS